MKRLTRSLLLILVASSLFLGAASGGDKEHQNQARAHDHSRAKETKQATPAFTIIVQPAPVKIIQQTAPIEKKGPAQKWYERPTITDWGVLLVTLAYVLISICLLRATNQQAALANASLKETKKATELARRTLVITQRPRLRVRNVVVQNPRETGMPPDPVLFRPNQYVSGQFYVSNNGGTKATVSESLCKVWWNQGSLPHRRPYEGENGNNPISVGTVIEPGGMGITALFSSDRPLGNEAAHIWQGGENWHLYVMGWIEYTDEIPSTRRMAFCRVFSVPDGGRFIPVENPDYEHGEE